METPAADLDPDFQRLAADLPAAWAGIPACVSGIEVAAAFIRAAYGIGYMAALTESASRHDILPITPSSEEDH